MTNDQRRFCEQILGAVKDSIYCTAPQDVSSHLRLWGIRSIFEAALNGDALAIQIIGHGWRVSFSADE
jgi:hypothetical protein